MNPRDEIEMLAKQTPELGMAVARRKQLSVDERARMLYEAREMAIMDEMARTRAAVAEAEARGRAEAEAEARDRAEGKAKSKKEVARKMMDRGFDLKVICEITDLSIDQVEALRGQRKKKSRGKCEPVTA